MVKCEDLPKTFVKTCPAEPLDVKADLSDLLASANQIIRIPIPAKDTTQNYPFPAGVKAFSAKMSLGNLKFSFENIGTSNFDQISAGSEVYKEFLDPAASFTLYFQSSKDSDILILGLWL